MPSPTYKIGDKYFDPVAKVEYICTTAGDKTSSAWVPISGGNGVNSNPQTFVIIGLQNGDTFTGQSWDYSPTGLGSIVVQIAKPNRFRTSLMGEVVDGVDISFSNYTLDNQRMASDGVNTEIQMVYPRYVTVFDEGFHFPLQFAPNPDSVENLALSRCVIRAYQPVGGTGLPGVTWEECSPARVWVRPYAAPSP